MSEFNDNKNINKRIVALLFSKYLKEFILLFLLILFVLSILFVVKPKYTKMKSASDILLNEKKDQLDSLDQYLKKLMNFNRSYRNITSANSDVENINKLIPEKNDFEDLIVMVDSMVRSRKLSLVSVGIEGDAVQKTATRIKTEPATDDISDDFPEKVEKITLKLSVEGADYETMKNLISDFEKSLRLIDVSEISFKDGSKSMSLTITAYYFQS